jgi:hypothetical protein
MSLVDINKFRLGTGDKGYCFLHDDLAAFAVRMVDSTLKEELLNICRDALEKKMMDLDKKEAGAQDESVRDKFKVQAKAAEFALLNGKRRIFKARNGNLKLVPVKEGIIRYDGSPHFYIRDDNGKETQHDYDERDWLSDKIGFEDPGVPKKKKKTKESRPIHTPSESSSDSNSESDSDIDSDIDSEEAVHKGENKEGGAGGKAKRGKKWRKEKRAVELDQMTDDEKEEIAKEWMRTHPIDLSVVQKRK